MICRKLILNKKHHAFNHRIELLQCNRSLYNLYNGKCCFVYPFYNPILRHTGCILTISMLCLFKTLVCLLNTCSNEHPRFFFTALSKNLCGRKNPDFQEQWPQKYIAEAGVNFLLQIFANWFFRSNCIYHHQFLNAGCYDTCCIVQLFCWFCQHIEQGRENEKQWWMLLVHCNVSRQRLKHSEDAENLWLIIDLFW